MAIGGANKSEFTREAGSMLLRPEYADVEMVSFI